MTRHNRKRSKLARRGIHKVGLPPGTLIHVGEQKTETPRITVFDYDELQFTQRESNSVQECYTFKNKPTTTWINVNGLHEVELIEELGKCFDLHPLLLEDILDTGQRPKIEDYEGYSFLVLRSLHYNETGKDITSEQLSLVLGPNFVISFQESEGDEFDGIRDRIKAGKGRVRKMGADYLVYSLMDAVVDNYFVILEKLADEIELLEEELVANPQRSTLRTIHQLKREMILLRRSVWPLREVIGILQRGDSPLVNETTHVYLRDVYDHTIQVIDTIETFRDMLASMLDIYLSSVSNRLNEVMKVLTIISTIFIPLTFLAGVYGMNFKHMPELEEPWAYPALWAFMILVGLTMVAYFKKRKWF
jgi:magnesium transporter